MKNWSWKKITSIFIAVGIVVAIAYDVIVINMSGPDNSISQVVIDWAYEFPIFSFMAGGLCGHLFWQMSKSRKIGAMQERIKELERQLTGGQK